MKILGVEIDVLSRKEIFSSVLRFLDEAKFHQVATVNPEFLVEADRNPEFKNVLNACDLRMADGVGISLVGFLQGIRVERCTGVDLMEEILRVANERKLSVYLAVRADGLSSFDEVREAIMMRFPDIKILGLDLPCHSDRVFEWRNPDAITEIPRQARNDTTGNSAIVFCNFGAPAQELFLSQFRNQDTDIRLAMGVGGAFDFITGKQKRAPKWLREMGLEWLWRLMRQPSRITRIWNATFVFLFKVVKSAILKP